MPIREKMIALVKTLTQLERIKLYQLLAYDRECMIPSYEMDRIIDDYEEVQS